MSLDRVPSTSSPTHRVLHPPIPHPRTCIWFVSLLITHTNRTALQSLVKRLSEELEQQGEAVNHHADALHQRDAELQAALERASRAQQELIAMEPPTLAQANQGLEVLLRVSTNSTQWASAREGISDTEKRNADESVVSAVAPRVWCLVKYSKKKVKRRSRSGTDSFNVRSADGNEDEREQEIGAASPDRRDSEGKNTSVDEERQQRGEGGEQEVASSSLQQVGGDSGEGNEPSIAGGASTSSPSGKAAEAGEGDRDDGVVAAPVESTDTDMEAAHVIASFPSAIGENGGDGESGDAAHVAAVVSPEAPDTVKTTLQAVDGGGEEEAVIEWRSQEEVDEWFALQLARATEEPSSSSNAAPPSSYGREATGGLADLLEDPSATVAQYVPPVALPVLDMPPTIQERFALEVGRVREELESRLEEATAELSRNTEAYKQYRARVRPRLGTDGRSEAVILQSLPSPAPCPNE